MSTQLHTIPQTAQRLGISRTSVYDLIAAGQLRVVDVGTGRSPRTRVRDDDLQAFIDGRTRQTA